MKWRTTIAICTFACISFSASAPISFQDDFAAMYPIEYYPAYFQNDFAKIDIDIAKWFRNAANSVKHFYSYVNALLFGRTEENERTIGRYPTFKENNNASDQPHAVNIQPKGSGVNLPHIQIVEMYKDSNGNVVTRKLTHQNGNFQFLQNAPVKSDIKVNKSMNFLVNENAIFRRMNSKIAMNPFHWNEKLEKDELFSGAFQNYAANPELLWHSGIVPFQPSGVFNAQGQNLMFQSQSIELPNPNVSDLPLNTEISDQKVEQNEPSSSEQSEASTIIGIEETKPDETSSQPDETSNSSNDETPTDSEYGNQYEIAYDIERVKNNNSDSAAINNDNEASPDTTESSEASVSYEINIDETNSDNDDDGSADLTELDTMQVSSYNENDEFDQNNQEPEPEETETHQEENMSDVNKSKNNEENSNNGKTLTAEKGTEKVEISEKKFEPVSKNTVINISQNSDESDIAEKVLAIVNPH